MDTTYTLTIPALTVWPLIVIALVVIIGITYFGGMTKTGEDKISQFDRLCDRLGFPRKFGPALPLIAVITAILIIAALATLWDFTLAVLGLGAHEDQTNGEAIRNIGLVLAALLAAPFAIWRAFIVSKQADLQDQSLFNDKINKASEDLAARRQITRVVGRGAKMQVLTEWEDDLVTRAAAIDRLHGLAQERPPSTPRIARQLSIYVRELSREKTNRPKTAPEGATPQELRDWARGLTPIRHDMEFAVQALGKLQKIEGHGLQRGDIDLREANLQGFDLKGLSFEEALFEKAQMQGADLSGAQMQGAGLFDAQMQGANLSEAQMQGADLIGAQMQGADLSWAEMQGADLSWAEMQGADLSWAEMQGADLRRAQMQGADLSGAQMQGADLSGAKMQGADLSGAQMDKDTDLSAATLRGAALRSVDYTTKAQLKRFWQDIFADGAVQLPKGAARPDHWRDEELDIFAFDQAWHAWRETLPKED